MSADSRKPRSLRALAHSWVPFGLGETKPRHFRDMARIAWENRDNLAYAWKVLSRGVCDGCALGTSGLKDWTIEGVHLCMVRLELLRLNTMPAADPARLADAAALGRLSSKECEARPAGLADEAPPRGAGLHARSLGRAGPTQGPAGGASRPRGPRCTSRAAG